MGSNPTPSAEQWESSGAVGDAGGGDMDLTNDSYLILISTKTSTERYYRDKDGWLKVSTRGNKFRATAEQVLNHLLPALAGVKPNLTVKVEHRERVSRATTSRRSGAPR